MKKLTFLAFLAVHSSLWTLPVYNPAQPAFMNQGNRQDEAGFELGYRGDMVINRKLDNRNDGNLITFNKDLPAYKRTVNGAQLTLDLWESIDVYGWLGSSQTDFITQVNYRTIIPGQPSGLLNLKGFTKEGFGYGYGARMILWKCRQTFLGVDAQYSNSYSKLQSISINDLPISASFGRIDGGLASASHFHLRHREYQVALGMAHQLNYLVPYLAIKYTSTRSKFTGPQVFLLSQGVDLGIYEPTLKFRDTVQFGFAAGVSIVNGGKMHVTAEGRFVDETALTVAADIKF